MKAQVLATDEIVEHIPCGPANKEVYASTDWGNGYITDVDTSIWDPGSDDTSGMSAQDKKPLDSNWSYHVDLHSWLSKHDQGFGEILPGRPPDIDFEHTIEFGLPRIDELIDELHGAVYLSEIDWCSRYHQIKMREKGVRVHQENI
jgi:hypothetical protein